MAPLESPDPARLIQHANQWEFFARRYYEQLATLVDECELYRAALESIRDFAVNRYDPMPPEVQIAEHARKSARAAIEWADAAKS